MDDALPMRVVEGRGDLPGYLQRFVQGELLLALELIAQRLALDVGHDVIEEAFGLPGVVERQNVGVTELRGDPDLAQEPLGPEYRRQLGAQNLHGDRTLVLEVPSEINGGHPAATELALDRVPIGEGGTRAIGLVGHVV